MHTTFWLKSLKGRDYSDNLGIDGRIILKWILMKQHGRAQAGLIWLRMVTRQALVNTNLS
jgi:hypothetical protein